VSRDTWKASCTALPTPVLSTWRIASIRSPTSIASGLRLCRRANVRSWEVRAAPRRVAFSIAETARCSFGSPPALRLNVCRLPLMIIRRLLKS
jgi:hypothetical protein